MDDLNKSSINYNLRNFWDSSTVFLFITNVLMIIVAIIFNWNVMTLLWTYWVQSVIIGFFNVIKIINLKDDNATIILENDTSEQKNNILTKLFFSGLFCVHYGFFHLVYAFFLFVMGYVGKNVNLDINGILLFSGIFFLNHLFSYIITPNKETIKDIGNVMFKPYLRIIPMHLTLMFGVILILFGQNILLLIIFMGIKTILDIGSHKIVHR